MKLVRIVINIFVVEHFRSTLRKWTDISFKGVKTHRLMSLFRMNGKITQTRTGNTFECRLKEEITQTQTGNSFEFRLKEEIA